MPRIEGSTVAEHRRIVLGRILDAFGEEILVSGFAALTLARVAARAGIARNTIYNYVRDKNELMLEFTSRQVTEYECRVRVALAELPTARERLNLLVRTQLEAFAGEHGSAAGLLEGGTLPAGVFGELMDRLSVVHALVREVLLEGVASGEFRPFVDVAVVVEMVTSAVGSQRVPIASGDRNLESAADAVITFIAAAVAR